MGYKNHVAGVSRRADLLGLRVPGRRRRLGGEGLGPGEFSLPPPPVKNKRTHGVSSCTRSDGFLASSERIDAILMLLSSLGRTSVVIVKASQELRG